MAKKNNTVRWVGIALTVLGIIAAIIISFTWVQADVKAVDKQTVINTREIETLDNRADTLDKALVRVETRQEIMLKGIDRINKKLE